MKQIDNLYPFVEELDGDGLCTVRKPCVLQELQHHSGIIVETSNDLGHMHITCHSGITVETSNDLGHVHITCHSGMIVETTHHMS